MLAARAAGLENPVLLEEPQAAFYCWIVTHQGAWQRSGQGRRADPSLRRRRRHVRLQPDHRHRDPRRPRLSSSRCRRPPDARRRQHRPRPGPSRREEAGRLPTRRRAVVCPPLFLPDGQGESCSPTDPSRPMARHHRRPGVEAHRRRAPVGVDPARSPRRGPRRLLPDDRPRDEPSPDRGARTSASRNSACRLSADPAISRHLAAFLRRHKPARRSTRPGPTPSSSTAVP